MNELLKLILLTLAPFLELRASIPYGILIAKLNWVLVFLVTVITNIVLAPIVYLFFDKFIHIFLRIKVVDRLYQKQVIRTQRKIHPLIEKYGVLGLALFIGVPLPGSGVYSGALGAYLLGFRKRDFLLAAIVGVLIAGIIVTLISTIGFETFGFLLKKV